ncbi:hypothetical protein ALC60_08699 [Trachymyrmex zeteki]|uniref:Uncharacterized protein n=1 Tax=Mycetomoellerius zeteki TaxID=64791 RepID=A0A151WWP8_9HYME|nr:hypothetical protein ALC60_08699 [Trachymyrmex zeteki]
MGTARFSVVSNRIRRGHAGDPSRGILAGDDTWLLQRRDGHQIDFSPLRPSFRDLCLTIAIEYRVRV